MGLTGWLAGRGVRAARVLVVECPGAWRERVAVERAVRARGWRLAESPASADVLLVVGEPTGLEEVVDRLWAALPGPRSRRTLEAGGDVLAHLDAAASRLADTRAQAEDAAARADPDLSAEGGMDHGDMDGDIDHGEMDHGGMGHEGMDHGEMDHGGMGHEGMDHGEMDHGGMGHEGMDHGDMEMAPDGIPLAEGSEEDRDGLEMDALPVRLGPVLPHWPAGLVLDVTLHGDLVVGADAEVVGHDGTAPDEQHPAARACDDAAAVLDLAGWAAGASTARAARDAFLDGRHEVAGVHLSDLRRRVSGSRLLRWSLRGVGVVEPERVQALGLPEHLAGDCLDRLHGLLDRAASGASTTTPAAAVGPLVEGCDLAVARLAVATLGSPVVPAGVRAHG